MSFPPPNNNRGAMEAFGMGRNSPGEEMPAMRSVALSGAPKLTPLPGGVKFGKAPPIGLPKPKGGLSQSRTSFTVTQEWTSTVSSAVWDVKGEDLEMVPVDFPLERTHREIRCDASEVAKRISSSLQKLSIDAEYDNEKAKAKCKTMECVKFRIRLYASGENGQPVVVEVQRRAGSTSSFMRSCRAVLDAAEGSQAAAAAAATMAPPKAGKFPPPMKNLGAMKCLQKVEVKGPSPEEEAAMAFDSAANLCKSEKYDSVVLGLQSLCSLTDPVKASPKVSTQVSKWMLLGHETHTTREDITAILSLEADEDDVELAAIFDQQKHFALMALANALDMLCKDGSLGSALSAHPWFETALAPALLVAVKQAETSASNAYAATRGIYSLLTTADGALRVLEENNGIQTLQMAHQVGLQTHDLLAREAGRCLEHVKGSS